MKDKNLATKETTPLANPGEPRRGFEETIDRNDLIIPRAKLLQALSPEVADGVQSPDGKDLKAGMVINSLTKEIMPSEFIPVFKFTTWIRFNPRNTQDPNFISDKGPGDMIWKSSDPLDQRVRTEGAFGPNGEKPAATKFLSFFAYFPGVPMPVIISFSNTSYKAGKQLLSLTQFSGGDMFSRKYRLGTKKTENDLGTFYVLTVDASGKADDADYKVAEKLWIDFSAKAKDIQVHEETASGEEVPF